MVFHPGMIDTAGGDFITALPNGHIWVSVDKSGSVCSGKGAPEAYLFAMSGCGHLVHRNVTGAVVAK
jgi:hypothetical protein